MDLMGKEQDLIRPVAPFGTWNWIGWVIPFFLAPFCLCR
uniref:Uncharacterized protein n=1 Tax=Arundo donax TaxID=35708 RepID=A0A0A8Z881_ARUDO